MVLSGPSTPAFRPFIFGKDESLGMSSIFTIHSSSCLWVGTPWSEEWCWHFVPTCGAGISKTLGVEAAGAGSLSSMAHTQVVDDIPRMTARGTSLIKSCRGYRRAL